MKMERFFLTFEASIEAVVYAPVGTTAERLREIASEIARNPEDRGWGRALFEARVDPLKPVEAVVLDDGHVVLSDDGQDIVIPTDATWWKG